jgi:hypothetical protein
MSRVQAWLSIPVGIILCGFLFVFAPPILEEPLGDAIRIFKSLSWHEVNAVIINSSVVSGVYRGKFRRVTKYNARVVYVYYVNGRRYSNWSQRFERTWHDLARPAYLESQKYKIGSTLKIKIDPEKPGWACYRCAVSFDYLLVFLSFGGVGMVSVLLPVLCIWMLFQGDRFLS